MALTICASGICGVMTCARLVLGVDALPPCRTRMEVTPTTAMTVAIAIAIFEFFLMLPDDSSAVPSGVGAGRGASHRRAFPRKLEHLLTEIAGNCYLEM